MNPFLDQSDTIISVLPRSETTLSLVESIDKNHNKDWLDLCSSNPKDVRVINAILSLKGFNYVDAPVSGGPKGIEEGKVSTIVSGQKGTVENLWPVISNYANNIYHISENVGTASMVKLANNTLLGMNLLTVAEVLKALENEDIDKEKALKFINVSSGRSWVTKQRYPDNILTNKYDYGFSYDLHRKDILTFMDSIDLEKIQTPFLKELKDIYEEERSINDHTEIVKVS